MSWAAALEDEGRRSPLARRRELSKLTKVDLIDRLIAAERALVAAHNLGTGAAGAALGSALPPVPAGTTNRENGDPVIRYSIAVEANDPRPTDRENGSER